MSLVLSISLMPFGGGWQSGEILWAYLPEVLLYHTFQPLHFVSHTPVCPLEGVESAVYRLNALFVEHAQPNPPPPEKRDHMVLKHV